MSKYIGMYDHLNKDDKLKIEIDIKDLVAKVDAMKYGAHRFLSELVNFRKTSEWYTENNAVGEEYREHTAMLEKLLEEGFY